MNQSANESFLNLLTSAGLPLLGLVLVFCLGLFLVMGYSMKFSLAAAGVGRFGFWKSVGIVALTTIATIVVSLIGALTSPENPVMILLTGLFSIIAYAIVIALVGRCGVGRGIKTYFYNGLFGTIGMVVFVIGFGGLVMAVGPMIEIDQDALARLKEGLPQQNQLSADSLNDGFETGIGSLTNVSFRGDTSDTDLNNTDIGNTEERAGGSTTRSMYPFAAPVNSSDDQVQDAFYKSVPKVRSETGRTESAGNTFKGVRENPFVQ